MNSGSDMTQGIEFSVYEAANKDTKCFFSMIRTHGWCRLLQTHITQHEKCERTQEFAIFGGGVVSSFLPQWTTALLLLVLERQKAGHGKVDKSNFISSTSFWASEGRREVAVREQYLGHPSFSSHISQQLSRRQNSTHTVWQQYWMLPLATLHILLLLHDIMLNRFYGCYTTVSNVSNTLFIIFYFLFWKSI